MKTANYSRREILKYGLCGCVALGLPCSLWLSGCRKFRPKRPNIFLIVIDTLRSDHMSCYGYPRNTTPNIDLFAEESMLYQNCLSHSPNTWSSVSSILSGFLPHETRVLRNIPLPAEVPTIPQFLQHYGYKSLAVVSNFVLRKGEGYEKGFTVYDDTMPDLEKVRQMPERIARHTTERAVELLKHNHKERLFMWIHYQDPHGPYTPDEKFGRMFRNNNPPPRKLNFNSTVSGQGGIPSYQKLGENRNYYHYVSQYDGEIRYTDEYFKQLITTMKELGLYEDALIILTSDHGEGMGEHNYYFAHGENLYNSLTRVPLIIKYGNGLKGKRKDYVQHVDIPTTINAIIEADNDPRLRGGDLRKEDDYQKEIFAAMSLPWKNKIRSSITFDGLKLIHTPMPPGVKYREFQLFDIKSDPYEKRDVFLNPSYHQSALDLQSRLVNIINDDRLKLSSNNVGRKKELREEEIEKLKSLGYTQ